jgi:hypothetical protein
VAKEQKLMSKPTPSLTCMVGSIFSKWHLRALPSAPNLRPHWSR